MGAENNGGVTPPEEITEQGKQPNAVPGEKNAEQPKMLTQEHVNDIVEARLARERKSLTEKLLGDYAAANPEELKAKLAQLTKAEEDKRAAEEAAKSNEQRLQEQIEQMKRHQVETSEMMRIKDIKYELSRIAPTKDVPSDRFDDLFMLMDITGIKFEDGKIDAKQVETAIDDALKTRDYLKSAPAQDKRRGTPARSTPMSLQLQSENNNGQSLPKQRKASI